MPKVKCGFCKTYVDREDALRDGVSSFCNEECKIQKLTVSKPRSRIKSVSTKRKADMKERNEVRDAVLARANGRCEYRSIIPEVRCGPLPERQGLECDEIHGGALRAEEWLNPDRIIATCAIHHDIKTKNKREILRRLEGLPHEALFYT